MTDQDITDKVSDQSPPFHVMGEDRFNFATMGFAVFRRLFTAAEVSDIERVFDSVLQRAAKSAGYNATKRVSVVPFIEADEFFLQLFDDTRVMTIVEAMLGDDCIYTGGSDGNYYVGNTRWHPDGGLPGYPTAKLAFYLDPVDSDSGCLSVIPGSHLRDFHDRIREGFETGVYDVNSPDLPGRYPLVSQPGDVVIFNHAIWHSSWGGRAGRRMFTINYAARPVPGWQTTYLNGSIKGMPTVRSGIGLYSARLVETAGPRRMKRLQRLVEQGYCVSPYSPLTEESLVIE